MVEQRSDDGPRIAVRRVESVCEKSATARGGLEKGRKIVAIQGVTPNGLTAEEYPPVRRTPVYDGCVWRVRRKGRGRTEDLRLAVGK